MDATESRAYKADLMSAFRGQECPRHFYTFQI